MPLAALKRLGTALLTPHSTSAAGATPETLFPVVSREEDGDDCDHDCEACPGYGRAFDKIGVETSDELWGQVKKYSTHIVVATGEKDWIRDVDGISGSMMEALSKRKGLVNNGRMMISASDLPPPHEYYATETKSTPKPTNLLLLPSFTVLEGVTPQDTDAVIRDFVNPGLTTGTPLAPATNGEPPAVELPAMAETEATNSPSSSPTGTIKSHPYPHDFLILICSHRRRDARCGISAPILRREFEKHLRPLGLWRDHSDSRPGGASVVFVNHVGGHKYAANVLIYRKEDGQGMWLARVSPKHVEGIVKYTLVKGKVVHPEMIRGGFNRRTGAASW